MEEAINIPKNLLIGLVLGVVVLGFLLIVFGGLEGLKDAWCNLNPTFCGENITYLATDDITAKNSVLALRCAINSVANNEVNDRTCPDSKPEYGTKIRLDGDNKDRNGIRRCYEDKCAVCILPEKKEYDEMLDLAGLGGVYQTTDGLNWTNIGAWADLGDVKFLVNSNETLFAGTTKGVFRRDAEGWKHVFKFSDNGLSNTTMIKSFLEHNESLFIAFNRADNKGLYKSVDRGNTWMLMETKERGSDITNIVSVTSAGGSLFLLSEGRPDYRSGAAYEAGRIGSGLYKSLDGGQTWGFVYSRMFLPERISEDEMNKALTEEGSSGGHIYLKPDKLGEGIGDVKGIVEFEGSLYAGSEIASEYFSDSDKGNPITDFSVKVITGGVFKSTDGGNSWSKLYHGDIREIKAIDGSLYIFDSDEGIVRSDGKNRWDIVGPKERVGLFVHDIEKYGESLFAGGMSGVFRSADGIVWADFINHTVTGYVNDLANFNNSLVIGSSEIIKSKNSNTATIGTAPTSTLGNIWSSILSGWNSITGETQIPNIFVQAGPQVDYCRVENFHLPQVPTTLEKWIYSYGDPKYLTYWQSFPPGEDSSWRSFKEWGKNLLFIAVFSMPIGQALGAGKRAAGEFFKGQAKKAALKEVAADAGATGVKGLTGETVEKSLFVVENGVERELKIAVPRPTQAKTLLYVVEKGVTKEIKRDAIEQTLRSEVGREIVEKSNQRAISLGYKDGVNTASRVLGFGTSFAFLAALLDSILTKYENFGNALVFKYHSKEPFRDPVPLPLLIEPQKTTAFVDGKDRGDYRESLKPVILDKEAATVFSRGKAWLAPYLKPLDTNPPTTVPFYLASPCQANLQVGVTTVYCEDYIYNPVEPYAYCKLATEKATKATNTCGVLMNDGKVIQNTAEDTVTVKNCAIQGIRVTVKDQASYTEDGANFCFTKGSWKAELAYAGTIAVTAFVSAYTGGFWLPWAVGVTGGIVSEYLEPDWPGVVSKPSKPGSASGQIDSDDLPADRLQPF